MAINTSVTPSGTLGIGGQLTLAAKEVANLTLPASTVALQIPFPVGLSTAGYVVIFNNGSGDLSFQLGVVSGPSIVPGNTIISVPVGEFAVVYGALALYLNSTSGGVCQVVFG